MKMTPLPIQGAVGFFVPARDAMVSQDRGMGERGIMRMMRLYRPPMIPILLIIPISFAVRILRSKGTRGREM